MDGVRLNRRELIERFGISNRLAVRVGALMAKKILLTETALESAGPGSPLEKTLLHPAVLEKADQLDSDLIKKLAEERDASDEPLAVIKKDDQSTIALEEEVLAEEGFAGGESQEETSTAESADSGTSIASREDAQKAEGMFRDEETRSLFTREEIARLKLDALASADPNVRISAIRRIKYSPLSDREKGGIYLQVLLDPVAPVRNEAITALDSLGFDPDTSRALRGIFSQEENERRVALDRMFALLENMSAVESRIILAVLLEAFREFQDVQSRGRILGFMADAARHVVSQGEFATEIIKAAVSKMMANPAEMERATESFLMALARESPAVAAKGIRGELDAIRDANIRALLIGVLTECCRTDEEKRNISVEILDEMAREELREINRQKIGQGLVMLGKPAVDPLLERFVSGAQRDKKMLVNLIDALCEQNPEVADVKSSVAAKLLTALPSGDPALRLGIAGARIFRDPSVPDRMRAQLAKSIARDLGKHTHPDAKDALSDALESLGAPSVKPLMEAIRQEGGSPAAEQAARALARLLVFQRDRLSTPESMSADFLKILLRNARDEKAPGGFLWALGLVGATYADIEQSGDIFSLLRSRLGRQPHHADIIDALGYMASGPSMALKDKIQIARILNSLLDRHEQEQDDDLLIKKNTPDGVVYEFAPRAEFDSVALPAVVDAARRFCLSEHVSQGLRKNMLDRMISVWNKVARWEVIWGPRSAESLAKALGELGAADETSHLDRERIGYALAQDIRRMSVVRAMRLMSAAGGETSGLDKLLTDAGERILDYWLDSDIAPEEREIVLRSAASIASRPQLPANNRSARLKRLVAAPLLEVLRAGQYWAGKPLEALMNSPNTPKELAKEIDKALRETLAVRKA